MHRTEAMDGRSPESRSWGPNPLTGFLGAALRQDFRPPTTTVPSGSPVFFHPFPSI